MEEKGLEPITLTCKAKILPIKLFPQETKWARFELAKGCFLCRFSKAGALDQLSHHLPFGRLELPTPKGLVFKTNAFTNSAKTVFSKIN